MNVDKLPVEEMAVDKMMVDKLPVEEMTVDKMTALHINILLTKCHR
jgi:hypothetical protein